MATNYSQSGETLAYTCGGTVTKGTPTVIGEQIGIPLESGTSGDVITMAMTGVFSVPKVTAAVIAQGESVIWDSSAAKFDDNLATPASGDVSNACTAWAAAGNGATTVLIKLNTSKGTVA